MNYSLSFTKYTNQLKTKLAYAGTALVLVTTSLGSGFPLLATARVSADAVAPIACQGSVDDSQTSFPSAPSLKTPLNGGSYNEHVASFDFAWNAITSPDGPVTYEWESSTSDQTDPSSGDFVNRLGHQVITTTAITDSNSPEDTYFWHVRAIDSNSVLGSWSDIWAVTINNSPTGPTDTIAPVVAFTGPTVVNSPTVLTATVTDDNPTACQFTVTDTAGNVVAGPVANSTVSDAAPNTVYYRFGTDNNGNPLPDGTYTVSLDASDVAGNHSITNQAITIDNTVPTVEVYNPTTDSKLHGTVAITGTASDLNLASYTVYACNTAQPIDYSTCWQTTVSPASNVEHDLLATLDTTQLNDGTYQITLIATDKADNQAIDFNTVTINNADATVQAPTLLFPVNHATTTTSNFSYSWNKVSNAYKPIKYQWELSTSGQTNKHGAFKKTVATYKGKHTSIASPINLADGTYYWHVRAINGDGIKSDWSETRTITYSTAPTPSNSGSNGSTPGTSNTTTPQILTAAATTNTHPQITPLPTNDTTDTAVLGTTTTQPKPSKHDTIANTNQTIVTPSWFSQAWYWLVALILFAIAYSYSHVTGRSKTSSSK